ncbi:hypothetical protein B7G68_12735 [Caulobacter segnis]|uniref:Uncharacterized protein n=2 Tax=Caulobacter segnis TaxID=88688 RepID=D5VKC0_CAUST|nr:hypothetical protein [Caulobacter segnis]ADG10943.1 conserved hypothetical protein [Caulobacter segnis ATCC 21756]AVQ02636.1 hypothetical protein B7G68_12735 [Caulobacter segnis]
MPELSDQQRRKLMALEPHYAQVRLVDLFERKCELSFRCLACGTSKTWRRDTMLGRARPLLGLSLAEIQRRTPCPRCGAHLAQLTVSGVWEPAELAERFRWEAIDALREAGVDPQALGFGWRAPGARR